MEGIVRQGKLRVGDKLTLMPTWKPAQAIQIVNVATMKQVEAAGQGELVQIQLNVSEPEDINTGMLLVSRENADSLALSKNIKAEIDLTSNAFTHDRLVSPGYSFVLHQGFTSVQATVSSIEKVIYKDDQ